MHEAGGLLYYDGANLNAILGKVRPGDMGFDAIHMNLHKTFSTPHGGGGPGAGAVGVSERLKPFLPVPLVVKEGDTLSSRRVYAECPQTIGQLSAFGGNAGVLIRAYVYARLLGREGMRRVGEYATLNANYLAARLRDKGFDLAYPKRRASHEFIVTVQRQKKENGITALDFSKSLLDYGIHAPTNYFPLLVPECLLIEPTETESKDVLDEFVEVMAELLAEVADRAGMDEGRAVHHAGAPPGRRQGRARPRPRLRPDRRIGRVGTGRPAALASRRTSDGRQYGQPRAAQSVPGLAGIRSGPCRACARPGRSESSFRLEVYLFVVLAPLAVWLGEIGVERAILIGSMMLVLVIEVLNSAVEAVVDRWGAEHNELAGRAKDMGSAAVFLADINVLMCWGIRARRRC